MRGFVAADCCAHRVRRRSPPAAANAGEDAAAAAFEAMSFQDKLAICAACHGAKGRFRNRRDAQPRRPAGQFHGIPTDIHALRSAQGRGHGALYARHDRRRYRQSVRGTITQALSPPPGAPDNDPALTKAGEELDNGHCEVCHLRTGKGDTPRIDGQREDYFVKAMQDYKSGLRNGRGLGVMPEVAYGMSDAEMRELAHYFCGADRPLTMHDADTATGDLAARVCPRGRRASCAANSEWRARRGLAAAGRRGRCPDFQ